LYVVRINCTAVGIESAVYRVQCEILDSHSSAAVNSGHLGCYAVSFVRVGSYSAKQGLFVAAELRNDELCVGLSMKSFKNRSTLQNE
jgi:hypothetical protein